LRIAGLQNWSHLGNPGLSRLITLDEIRQSRKNLPAFIRRTPILPIGGDPAETGREGLFVKAENLQVTGAYKPRAAFSILNAVSPKARTAGVVMSSSGNFAQAFAYAGASMGVPVVVVMPEGTSPYKIDAARGYGAEVCFCRDTLDRQPTVERIARERGMTAIDTWEHPMTVVGHGTLGLEILEDLPDVEQVLVPVGSAGLAAGIATAVKESRPGVKVIGVQPERANAAYVSLQRGEPVTIDDWDSIADGLAPRRPGDLPFRHIRKYLDGIVLIAEADIASTFRTLLFRGKVLAEPAGAVAPAAFLTDKVDTACKTIALVTGGNLTEAVMRKMLEMPEE
jgi:threonine dehydratase